MRRLPLMASHLRGVMTWIAGWDDRSSYGGTTLPELDLHELPLQPLGS